MQVQLDKRYPIAGPAAAAWAVLGDIRATAACMPGAQITEELDETHFSGTVKSRIGPAVMAFAGQIELLERDAQAQRLRLLGKGADRGGSQAQMELTAHLEAADDGADGCVLVGSATVNVSGKLATFGNRLLVPVSDAMLAQFADNFRAAVAVQMALAPAATAPSQASPAAAPGDVSATAAVQAASADASAAAMVVASRAAVARPAPPPASTELNVLALAWAVIRGWFSGLFKGRR